MVSFPVHQQFYNLPLGILPHFILLGAIPCCLYQLQVVFVEGFINRCINALVLAWILYLFTQKSMRIHHSDKKIKKVTEWPSNEFLEAKMQIGDPLLDTLTEKSFEMGVKRPLQYSNPKSYEHIQHLPEFRELQKQLQTVPAWVDHERIEKAYSFYQDNITLVYDGMGTGLVESYTYPIDAKVLEINGGLVGVKGTMARLNRTARFVHDVVSNKTAPEFGSEAFNRIVNIRFIHAFARKFCKDSPDWNEDFLPINQFAQSGTLIFFCQTPIELMRKRGIAVSPEEAECAWQLWRYVGYLMGVDEDMIPETYEHGLTLKYHPVATSRQNANEASGKLAETTIEALSQDIRVPFDAPTFRVKVMKHLGEDVYKALNLPMPTWFDLRHYDLMNFWESHIRFCDYWSSFLRKWKNFFFTRYFEAVGIARPQTSQPKQRESFY